MSANLRLLLQNGLADSPPSSDIQWGFTGEINALSLTSHANQRTRCVAMVCTTGSL
ncbi:hypothetical protein [Zymomonas mobilis]|uniref:hypothetical protein n=1 Tax=Zymomonas mobilis TaxID=542 RepID=UPI001365364F|nr:hypothetical protein [Zymomonas mobilis]UBQ08775.1 hypothetical protein LB319_09830 [Zymomonas mobilis]